MNNRVSSERFYFIDTLKLFACILVVIGHFTMSMMGANIVPITDFNTSFIRFIYTFHVPIFFVCSGFLYQHSNRVHSPATWWQNIRKKLLDLGVPYLTFSVITLLLKVFFKDSVNTKLDLDVKSFFRILFIEPYAPYWYLYALFVLFLAFPCVKTKRSASLLLTLTLTLWLLKTIAGSHNIGLSFILKTICQQSQWFALGMLLACFTTEQLKKAAKIALPTAVIWSSCAMWLFEKNKSFSAASSELLGLGMVSLLCALSVLIQPDWLNRLSSGFSKFFMPVFLTHTIFSAGVRILLLKLGFHTLVPHILGGIIGGFVLPVMMYCICEKLPIFMFFFYPSKSIKKLKEKRNGKIENAYSQK